jgi:hypothetical protein
MPLFCYNHRMSSMHSLTETRVLHSGSHMSTARKLGIASIVFAVAGLLLGPLLLIGALLGFLGGTN